MAYEPTNWQKGDIVTAEKLNKLEGAIASTCLYGQITDVDSGSAIELNIKARDLVNAVESGIPVFANYNTEDDGFSAIELLRMQAVINLGDGAYQFGFLAGSAAYNLIAASLDDYPKEEW